MATCRNPQAAFSLIELLVVISIIAILAAMLLPAIAMVRSAAKSARCASNVRQLVLQMSVYGQDCETLPPPNGPEGSGIWSGWDQRLLANTSIALTEFQGVLVCPLDTRKAYDAVPCFGNKTNTVYGMLNGRRSYAVPAPSPHPANFYQTGMTFIWDFNGNGARSSALPLAQVAPDTILIVDYFSSQFGTCWGSTVNTTENSWDSPTLAHRGKFTTGFADGHVALLAPRDTYGSTGVGGVIWYDARGLWTPVARD